MEKIDQILESLYDRVIEPVEAKEQLLLLFGVRKRTTCPKIKTCKVTPQHCACDMRDEYVC